MKIALLLFFCGLTLHLAAQQPDFLPIQKDLALLDKWAFLKKVLKNKRIVGLGESLHGVQDYNLTKIELIKYLHEELGYNVLAIEGDVARNYIGNRERANIPDSILLKELFPAPWHTPEYLAFIGYLKTHPKLQVIGFDVEHKLSLSELADRLTCIVDGTAPDLVDFEQHYATWREVNGGELVSASMRDTTMASIAKWIISDLYRGEKIILSAHNLHLSKVPDHNACMGVLLKQHYKKQYYCIGFFHSLGNPKHVLRNLTYKNDPTKLTDNSVQAKFLTHANHPQVFVPIQQCLKKRYPWLFQSLDHIVDTKGRYLSSVHLADSYDGLIWIKKVTHPEYLIPNAYLDQH